MRSLPLGWATDLAVLEHTGSLVDEYRDHLVVRTPGNPEFHWGNCIFVTDPGAVDDADRWVAAFHGAIPGANWIAIGLPHPPTDARPWERHGLDLELDDVLATATMPRQTAAPVGYVIRGFEGEDWDQLVAREMAVNEETTQYDAVAHERFARVRVQSQRALVERRAALFVGAFFEGRLIAELGIVACGVTARYQSVGTAPEHRSRGIASHLLGVAAVWAGARGCTRWVIVTEAANPAGRVYRRAGFELVAPSVQAYRAPR